jgi:hypothetical protein
VRSRPVPPSVTGWQTTSSNPRLAAVYDALDPDRSDLNIYAAIVTELGAQRWTWAVAPGRSH